MSQQKERHMKVEIRQLLTDISFFRETISGIRFICEDNSYFTSFPSVAEWTGGDVVLELRTSDSAAEIISRLADYNIVAVPQEGGYRTRSIRFAIKSDNDIICVLHKAFADSNLRKKAHQLDGLNQNVDQLVQQLPHVRHGAFSRGVKAMKNQIDTLKNIRAYHQKER